MFAAFSTDILAAADYIKNRVTGVLNAHIDNVSVIKLAFKGRMNLDAPFGKLR